MSFKKFVIGGAIAGILLVVLFFIPAYEFSDANLPNSESPPHIVVLTNYPEDFEIIPISCKVIENMVEFEFDITNNLDEDYFLEIELALNNKDNLDLSRKAVLVQVESGQTTNEKHQTPFNPDMNSCVIELDRIEKIP